MSSKRESSKKSPKMFQIPMLFPTGSSNAFHQNPLESNMMTPDVPISTSPYFVSILNLASIFGFVPFKLEMEEGSYKIIQLGILRKVFCAITHFSGGGMYIYYNVRRLIFVSESPKLHSDIAETFDLVANCGTATLNILFTHTLWMRQSKILELVEGTRVHQGEKIAKKHQFLGILLFLAGYICCFYIVHEIASSHNFYNCWASKQEALIWWIPFKISLYLLCHSMSIAYFTHTCLVMVALGMRSLEGDFSSSLEETLETGDIKKGLVIYMGLKQLLTKCTRTFGPHLLTYYVISVAYFAKITEPTAWKHSEELISILMFFGVGSVICLTSAEFHMKIRDAVKNWATRMQDADELTIEERIKLLSIVNDNLLDPIGISCKFFTVSYGFLGSMLGLIVTYAIIVFQMQATNNSTNTTIMSPLIIEELNKLYTALLGRSVEDSVYTQSTRSTNYSTSDFV